MARRPSRRQFLQTTGMAGLGFWVAGGLGVRAARNAGEKLNIASIGVGGKGDSDCRQAAQFGNLVAICDIDEGRLDAMGKAYPKAEKFFDFREMLTKMGKDIDAVTVSTADHTHAPASMMAMKLKKHVYCQKPLTWSVAEARALRQAAKAYGVCTQMGNQGSAEDGLRRAVEMIQDGVIGPIKEAHVWTNRCSGFWKQAPDITTRPKRETAPKAVHFDLWLGPAPERPYSPLYHPFAWRGWRDFGTGALGDMACHTANMAFRALKLGLPTAVSAVNSEVNPETFQQWATIVYEFPARGDLPPVKLTWWEGQKMPGKRSKESQNLPPKELFHGEDIATSGSLLIGTKGTLYSPNDYGAAYVLLPKKQFEGYRGPEKTLPRKDKKLDIDTAMKAEWVDAINAGKPEKAYSNFEYASTLTEAMLLGNIAIVAGKRIEYDGDNMRIPNLATAEKLLSREYRSGWTL